MTKNPTSLEVVAAAIQDASRRLLLQRALPGKRHAGLWELPGGKVEPGETPRAALVREINEELGIDLAVLALEPAGSAEARADEAGPGIVLRLYTCSLWGGSPASLEGQEWGWFTLAEASALPLAPLDRALLASLSRDEWA